MNESDDPLASAKTLSGKDVWRLAGAFAVVLGGLGLAIAFSGAGEWLVEPSPDLDWPLGLLGVAIGLWAAHVITRHPVTNVKRAGAVILWIMLPLWLSYGLICFGDQMQGWFSFRHGMSAETRVGTVIEKNQYQTRRRRTQSRLTVVTDGSTKRLSIPVDPAVFSGIVPYRDCVLLLTERADDGAMRLRRPLAFRRCA